ncbi:putative glutamine/gamma-aminobutyrate antiporter GadC [Marinibaculum pumilum]|uniref:Glutamine/gamma-aminobutyrate antiporter GadC n=1 Tax=Marinibaculum pumilum TaxID=1766165 RepID=A0ABV7L0A4_9PROT
MPKDAEPGAPVGKAAGRITVVTLAVMNLTAVVSLRGLPAEAEYGMAAIAYYLFAAFCFLVPVAIVAAELATAWPQRGGIFRWVGEAFGARAGFLAIFLLWVQNVVWFPTVLTFGAVALAFAGPDQGWDEALAANRFYTLTAVLAVYWLATAIALRGVAAFTAVAKWGGLVGTIIPAALLIGFGIAYHLSTGQSATPLTWSAAVPDLGRFDTLVLAASIFLFYAGMEMNAVHVRNVTRPERNYPLAILISSLAAVAILALGTLAVAMIVPRGEISLVLSLLLAFDAYFAHFGLAWLGPVVAVMLAFGVLGGVTVWVSGPSSGILAVGRAGYLPPVLQRTNAAGAPVAILLLQAGLVTLLSLLFVILPSVQATYQILGQLTAILYLVMYLMMFAAALVLRYRRDGAAPGAARSYRVPGGRAGLWLFAGTGFAASLLAMALSFVPPGQIAVGSPTAYIGLLAGGAVLFIALPMAIYALRKPHWHRPDAGFEPFSWERGA